MAGPKKFTSDTPLPKSTGGSDYPVDTGGGAESNANPEGVREYGVFHGDPYRGMKKISESDPMPGKSGNNPSLPEGVFKYGDQLPKKG